MTPTDLTRSLPDWLDLPEPRGFRPKRKYRTVWISDIHLGTRGCNAGLLLDFLRSIDCETLYLVGDIVDGWRLRKGWYGRRRAGPGHAQGPLSRSDLHRRADR